MVVSLHRESQLEQGVEDIGNCQNRQLVVTCKEIDQICKPIKENRSHVSHKGVANMEC